MSTARICQTIKALEMRPLTSDDLCAAVGTDNITGIRALLVKMHAEGVVRCDWKVTHTGRKVRIWSLTL